MRISIFPKIYPYIEKRNILKMIQNMRQLNPKLALDSPIAGKILILSMFGGVYAYRAQKIINCNISSVVAYLRLLEKEKLIELKKEKKKGRIKKIYTFKWDSPFLKKYLINESDVTPEFIDTIFPMKGWQNILEVFFILLFDEVKIGKKIVTRNNNDTATITLEIDEKNFNKSFEAEYNSKYNRDVLSLIIRAYKFYIKLAADSTHILKEKDLNRDFRDFIARGNEEDRKKLDNVKKIFNRTPYNF